MTAVRDIDARLLALLEIGPASLTQLSLVLNLHRTTLSGRLKRLAAAGRVLSVDGQWRQQ